MRVIRSVIQMAVLTAALVLAGCGAPQQARPVRIESSTFLTTFDSWLTWISAYVEGEPQGLLLKDGDIVSGGEVLFQYAAGDGPVLLVTATEWNTRLSGEIVSLAFESDSARQWMEIATKREIAGLRLVGTPDSLDDATLRAFKRLAAVNPNVGLVCGTPTALQQVLPLFQPRVLLMFGSAPVFGQNLANLKKLETLGISCSDSASLDFLPALRRLRRLILDSWDVEEVGPLPAGIKGLRSITVLEGTAMQDSSALRAAPAGLEELSLLDIEGDMDLGHLAHLPALRTLILNGSEVSGDLAGLAGLKRLRRVGLPRNVTQRQFAALVTTHPDLKILEIVGTDSLTDLAPLHRLKRLEGLVLDSPNVNVEEVKGLTSLRFLGVGISDTTQASRDRLASMKKALPDALVIPVAPYKVCLGSGWILFLIPVSALFWFLGSRRRKPNVTGERSA